MSERYTIKRGDKWLVPKDQWPEAAEKLARYEDAEELEDVQAYCLELERAAEEIREKHPEISKLIRRAADEIVSMSNWHDSTCKRLLDKARDQKKTLLTFLDEIDGQITDDPVTVIREKLGLSEEIILGGQDDDKSRIS